MSGRDVFPISIGLVAAVLNLAYWWWVVRRGMERARRWVEKRWGVTVTYGFRGTWNVSGSGSKARDFFLELLQIAYFMACMFVWAVGMIAVVLVQSAFDGSR